MVSQPRSLRSAFLVAAAALLGSTESSAADIQKAANTDALNLGTSWVGGSVPSGTDMIVFDSLYNNGTGTTVTLGASSDYYGFRFGAMSGTAGSILTIGDTTSYTLGLGAGGIDASASNMNVVFGGTAVQTLNITANQTWSLAGGRTLTTGGTNALLGRMTGSGDITLSQSGSGTATFELGADSTGATNYSGNWYIGANVLAKVSQNNAIAWGKGRIYVDGGRLSTGIGRGGNIGNWTWNNDVILQSGGATIDNTNTGSGRTLVLNTHIAGSGALTFANGVNLALVNILNAGNSYTGGTIINANAQVRVGNGGVLGSLGSGTVTINSTTNPALNISRTGIFYLGNTITGAGRLDFGNATSSGLNYVTGANSYSGITAIYGSAATFVSVNKLETDNTGNLGTGSIFLLGGNLIYTGAAHTTTRSLTLGAVTTSAIYANGTGALIWNPGSALGGNGVTGTRTFILGGTNTGDNTFGGTNGVITNFTGATSFLKTNLGKWVLNQAQTYTGTTTLAGGTLQLDFSGATAAPATILPNAAAVTFTGSAQLDVKGRSATASTQNLGGITLTAGNAILTTTTNSATSIALNLGGITRSAGGGVLQFMAGGSSTISTTASNTNGILGAWAVINTGANQADYAVGNGAGVAVSAYNAYTTLTTAGANSATTNYLLAGGATMAGATTGNVLKVTTASGGTTLALGTNAMTVNGLLVSNGATTGNLTITGSGTGVLGAGSAAEFIINTYTSSNVTISAPLISTTATAGSLTKTGYGTLFIAPTSGSNAFTGAVTVNQGTLEASLTQTTAGTYTPLGTGAITVNAGSTLRFKFGSTSNSPTYSNAINLRDATLASSDGKAIYTGAINSTGWSTISTGWTDKSARFNGVISGSGFLTLNSTSGTAGDIIFNNAANTFTGQYILNAGTLNLGSASATPLGNAAGLTINSGTTAYVNRNGSTGTYALFTNSTGVIDLKGTLNISQSQASSGQNLKITIPKLLLNGGTITGTATTGTSTVNINGAVEGIAGTTSTITTASGGYGRAILIDGEMSGAGTLSILRPGNASGSWIAFRNSMVGYAGNINYNSGTNTTAGYLVFGGAGGWGSGTLTTGANAYYSVILGNAEGQISNNGGASGTGLLTGTMNIQGSATLGAGSSLLLLNQSASAMVNAEIVGAMNINGATLGLNGTHGAPSFTPYTNSTWTFGTALSTISAGLAVNYSGATFNVGDAVVGSGNDLLVSGVVSGSKQLTKSGAGTMALTATNTTTGGFNVTAGTLNVGNSGTAGDMGSGTVAIGASGTVSVTRSNDITVANTLTGAGTFSKAASAGMTTLTGNLSGFSGTFAIANGTSTVTNILSLANGASTPAAVTVGQYAALRSNGTAAVGSVTLVSGGNLQVQVADPTTATSFFTTSGTVAFVTGAGVVVSNTSAIAEGTYRILNYGSGALTYNGGTDITGLTAIGLAPSRNTFTLVNDTIAKTLDMTVSGVAANLVWNGTLAGWDASQAAGAGTAFNNTGTAAADYFYNFDNVTFDDSLISTAQTIAITGTLSPGGTMTVAGAQDYTFNGTGALSGAANIVKNGTGTLRLANTGTNALNGSITVNGGKLAVTDAYAMSNGGLILNTGTTFTSTATKTVGKNLTASGSVTLGDSTDTGALTFSATNNLSGLTDLTANVATTFSGTTTIGTALTINGTGAVSVSSALALAGNTTLTINGAGGTTLSGVLSGTGYSLTKEGNGKLTLSAANTYTGGTTVNAGTVQFGVGAATTVLPAGNVSVASGATLAMYSSSGGLTVANAISGAGTISLMGTGTASASSYAFSGIASTFTGNWSVESGARLNAATQAALGANSGTITVASGGGLYLSGSSVTYTNNIVIAGAGWTEATLAPLGAIRFNGASTTTGTITLAGNANITAYGTTGTITGNIGESVVGSVLTYGNATLAANSSGTITINGTNTYTGGTNLAGVVTVNANSSGAFGTGAVTIGGNASYASLLVLANGIDLANAVTLNANAGNANGVVQLSGTRSATISGLVTLGVAAPTTGNFFGIGTGTLSLLGGISSVNNVGFGAGNYVLGGGGTYTTLSTAGGSLKLGSANGIATGATLTLGSTSAATFDLNGNSQSNAITLTPGAAGLTVTNTGSTASLNIANTGTTAFNIGGNVALTLSGSGTKVLSGSNTYTGGTTVTNGSLEVTALSAIGTGGLNLNSGNFKLTQSTAATLGGALAGSGSFTKEGSGSLTLGTVSDFTGALNINAGSVVINGATLGGSTVAAGGNLVTIADGASLSGGFTTGRDIRISGSADGISTGALFRAGNGLTAGTFITTGTLEFGYGDALGGVGASRLNVLIGESTSDVIDVTGGTLKLLGDVSVSFLNGGFGTGTYTILTYDVANASNDLTGTLLTTGTYGHTTISEVTHDALAGTFSVDVAKASMIWVGDVDGNVDATTANFKLSTTSVADTLLAGDELVFNDTATTRTVTLVSGIPDLGKITIDTTLGYTIGGTGSLNGTNAQLLKTGSGTLTLGGSNGFGGGLHVEGGTIAAASDAALGVTGGSIYLGAGTTFQATETFTLGATRAVNLEGNANISADSGKTLTYAGSIAGAYGLTKTGNGTLSLSGASTYTGGTTLSTGTLELAANNALLATGALTLNGGTLAIGTTNQAVGTLTSSAGTISGTGTIAASTLAVTGTLSGTGTINALSYTFADGAVVNAGLTLGGAGTIARDTSGTVTLAANLANTGGVSVSNGTLILSGANTYTGGTTLSGTGVIQIGSAGALGAASASLTLNGGTLSSDSATDRTLTAAGASTIGGNVTFGDTTNTGLITLTNAFNLGGDTRTLSTATGSGATLSGILSNGGITKDGNGTLNLNAANTYIGGLTVNAGTLATTNASGFGAAANVVTLSPGSSAASLLIAYGVTVAHNITISGTGTGIATIGSTYSASTGLNTQYSNTITLGRNVTLLGNTGDRTTFAGKITGTGNVTISSAYATFANSRVSFVQASAGVANDFTGDLIIADGSQLQLGIGTNTNNFAIPDASNVRFTSSNSYFRFSASGSTGGVETVNALISDNAGAGLIQATEGNATLTIGSANGSGTFSGVIGYNGTNTLNITKIGTGNQVLSGNNTFIGATTLTAGTLTLGHTSALGKSTLTLNGGTLVLDSTITSFTFGGLAAASAGTGYDISLSTATETPAAIDLTVGANNGTSTYAGVLSGLGSLTKVGTGNLILSGVNTYAGSTSINAGTLTVADGNTLSSDSAISLATGATLNFSGTAATLANNITIGATAGTAYIATPNTSATTLGGVISGGGAGVVLYLQGGASGQNSGAITLAGNNTFAGTISVQRGPVILGNANAAGSAVIELNSNAAPAGALQFSDSFTVNNNITLFAGALIGVASDKTNTLSGVVSGSSVLNKVGAGTLVLTGANTFTGGVTVTAGTLQLGAANALPGTSGTLTTSGGTLDLGGYTVTTTGALAANSGSVTNGTITAGSYSSSGAATITAVLAGTGTFTKTGAGTTTTLSNSTLSGTVAVSSGTLALAGGNTSLGTVSIASGAVFSVTGGTNTVASVGGGSGATFNATGGTLNVVGSIGGSGSAGSSWTIGTGATVNAASVGNSWNPSSFTVNGTLNLSSTSSSAFNQSTNAAMTIGGTGTINIAGGYANSNAGATVTTITVNRMNIGGGASGASVAGLTRNAGTIILGSASTATTIGVFTRDWSSSAAMSIGTAGVTFDTQDSVDGTTGRTISLSGVLSDHTSNTGTLTKTGNGTLTLSRANTFSGALTVNGGTLNLNGTHLSVASIAANNGSTINVNATNFLVGGHATAVADSRTISATGGSSLVFSSAMEARLGNVNLSGSTFTSNRGLTGWDVLLANVASGAATVTVTGTSASTMNGTGGIHLSGVQNFNVADATSNSDADLVVSMQLADGGTAGGLGGINKTGAGTMSLTNANNSFTGNVTVGAGTFEVGGAGRLNAGSYAGTVTNNGVLSIATSADQTLSGVVSGTGSLSKTGNGTLTLSATNTYTGDTTVNGGTLKLTQADALSASSALTIGANGTFRLDYALTGDTTIGRTFSGSGIIDLATTGYTTALSGLSGFTGSIKLSTGTVFDATTSSWTGGLVFAGGSLFGGLSSYTGEVNISNGATLNVADGLPTNLTLSAGGTLDFTGVTNSNITIQFAGGTLANASGFTGNVNVVGTGVTVGAGSLGGGTLVLGSGSSVNVTGTIGNAVTVSGGSIQGGNNVTGNITVTSGSFTIGAPSGTVGIDVLNAGATVAVAGGTLNLNGGSAGNTINFTSGSINNGSNFTGTINVQAGNLANSSNLGGSIVVNDTGKLTNNGTLSGDVTVEDGGTLAGSGTFTSASIATGGILSPGNSPGVQTYTTSLTLAGGSIWVQQIYSEQAVLTAGDHNGQNIGARGYDTIVFTSNEFGDATLDLSDAVLNPITLRLVTLTNWSDATGGVPTGGNLTYTRDGLGDWIPKEFVIATYTGTAIIGGADNVSSLFAFDTSGFYFETGPQASAGHFTIFEYYNNDTGLTELTLRVVPEPSTYGLILGGLALVGAAVRRRRRQAK